MPVPGDSVAGRINLTTGEVLLCRNARSCSRRMQRKRCRWRKLFRPSDCYDDETGTEIGYISEIPCTAKIGGFFCAMFTSSL